MTFTSNGSINSNTLPFVVKPLEFMDETLTAKEPTASLRERGYIRVHGAIPIELNERLKSMARKQNQTADQLIGELIIKSAGELDRWEAEQEVAKLKERFGANWIEVLKQADTDAA